MVAIFQASSAAKMPRCNVSGTKIYYEASGKEGTPIIFVSGTGFHSGIWKPFQVPFFSKERRVIISDHRGLGRSDKPDEPYSTRQFASDILGVMDHLGIEHAHVLGHSMGGRVAQWLALDNPKRLRSLNLASSGSGNFSRRPDYIRGIPLPTAFEIASYGFTKYFRHHVQSEFFFTQKFLKSRSTSFKKTIMAHSSNPPMVKIYLRHVIARQMHETSDRVNEIQVPTLVTVGALDTEERGSGSHYESAEWLAKSITNSTFVPITGAKHGTLWEKSKEMNRLVSDFIAKHD